MRTDAGCNPSGGEGDAVAKTGAVLFLVTHASFFISHRLALARTMRDHGYKVIVATHADIDTDLLDTEGFEIREIAFERQGINIFHELRTIMRVTRVYRQDRPALVHHIGHKAILYGGLAARFSGVAAVVGTLTGLGYAFVAPGIRARSIRLLMELLYVFVSRFSKSNLIFQNFADYAYFTARRLVPKAQANIILGSGVSCTKFHPRPEPLSGRPIIVTPARMLWSKGIGDLVEAAILLRKRGVDARFILAGLAGDDNPQNISVEQLQRWNADGIVEWIGVSKDMPALLASAQIVCLPSHREGLPLALAEAAAAGRPIVTTDTPGCREVVEDGVNGFLVPLGDCVRLADRIEELLDNPELRRKMGHAGRQRALQHLALERIIQQTTSLYWRTIGIE